MGSDISILATLGLGMGPYLRPHGASNSHLTILSYIEKILVSRSYVPFYAKRRLQHARKFKRRGEQYDRLRHCGDYTWERGEREWRVRARRHVAP